MKRPVDLLHRILALGTLILLPVALWAVFYHAPVEREMGIMQKVFYLHLPVALGSFFAFFVNFVGCVGYLIRRNPAWERTAVAGAEVGLLLATLTLVSGSLWARPIWNTWWTWEPRLTTMLLLWFLYLAYLVLRGSVEDPRRRAVYSSIWGVLAFADVPLVYFSVHWFERQLHPVVIEPGKGVALAPAMVDALLLSLVAFGFLIGALLLARYRLACLESRHAGRVSTHP